MTFSKCLDTSENLGRVCPAIRVQRQHSQQLAKDVGEFSVPCLYILLLAPLPSATDDFRLILGTG